MKTVVPLLYLACVYKHLYAKRKVSIRTPFVMKQRKDWVTDRSASQPSEETSWGFSLVEKKKQF